MHHSPRKVAGCRQVDSYLLFGNKIETAGGDIVKMDQSPTGGFGCGGRSGDSGGFGGGGGGSGGGGGGDGRRPL